MFSHATLLYLFVETPLHAGSGRGLGAIDLPIQRERATDYPLVQASGIKGKLRAEAYATPKFIAAYEAARPQAITDVRAEGKLEDEQEILREAAKRARRKAAQDLGLEAVFGPESEHASDHAGAISPGDARLLLLPVRSLAGVFAWTTSANALARFRRDATAAGVLSINWNASVESGSALVAPNSDVKAGDKVVLEEFSYSPREDQIVQTIGEWLAANALPTGNEYGYWRTKLPRSLVILPEDDFRDFALYATEVVTRIKLNSDTKTVDKGALWTEESLPVDTLLYAPVFASDQRNKPSNGTKMTGKDVLEFVSSLGFSRLQVGGDETVGRGLVAVRFGEVNNA